MEHIGHDQQFLTVSFLAIDFGKIVHLLRQLFGSILKKCFSVVPDCYVCLPVTRSFQLPASQPALTTFPGDSELAYQRYAITSFLKSSSHVCSPLHRHREFFPFPASSPQAIQTHRILSAEVTVVPARAL